MKNKLLILILVAIFVGLGILKVGFDTQAQIGELAQVSQIEFESQATSQATLIIDKEDSIEKEVSIEAEQTVFGLLKKSGVEFDYEDYESGAFITSIEGISDPVKNWTYYVNGKLGEKAVDKKRINEGDVVKFKHQRSPF